MTLRTTFEQLVEMLRDEIKSSSNTSRSADNLAYLQRVIKRHYETLADEYEWSFLRVARGDARKTLEAGERYYDFPVEMDVKDTIKAWHFYGNVWVELRYDISFHDYNAMNPDTDQRADPQLAWKVYNERQFEVWPTPASNGNLIEFTGRRAITPLTGATSRADMDDQLIVLYAAADIENKQKPGSGDYHIKLAQARLLQMKRKYGGGRRVVRVGMGSGEPVRMPASMIRAYRATN